MKLTLSRREFLHERDAVLNGMGSHAYIIEGSEGIGKMSYALAVSCVYFCKDENKPCLECSGCRKVLDGTHPDVHIIKPEKNILRVDAVREMLSTVYESPYEGVMKIYIFDDFHKANEQAQNALLKTLEEPPRSVAFFLLTENSYALLDTIRSRCKKIHLGGFTEQQIYDELQSRFPDNESNRFVSDAVGGNIGDALRLIDDSEALRLARLAQKLTDGTLGASETADVLEKEKDILGEVLYALENRMVILFRKNGKEELLRLKAVQDAIASKNRNVNNGLITEELAYALAKGGTKWQR